MQNRMSNPAMVLGFAFLAPSSPDVPRNPAAGKCARWMGKKRGGADDEMGTPVSIPITAHDSEIERHSHSWWAASEEEQTKTAEPSGE
jgi:hypothetical protein